VRECVSETSVLVSGGMAHCEGTSVLSSLLYSQHSTLASTARCFVLFKKKRAVRRSLPLRQRAAAATASWASLFAPTLSPPYHLKRCIVEDCKNCSSLFIIWIFYVFFRPQYFEPAKYAYGSAIWTCRERERMTRIFGLSIHRSPCMGLIEDLDRWWWWGVSPRQPRYASSTLTDDEAYRLVINLDRWGVSHHRQVWCIRAIIHYPHLFPSSRMKPYWTLSAWPRPHPGEKARPKREHECWRRP